jgi:hypothetical protein
VHGKVDEHTRLLAAIHAMLLKISRGSGIVGGRYAETKVTTVTRGVVTEG